MSGKQERQPLAIRMLDLCQKFDIVPNTEIGQHFLINENVISLIADQIPHGVQVLEIGAGLGQITEKLAQRAKEVTAIEIDRKFEPVLSELQKRYRNIKPIYGDVLKLDLSRYKRAVLVGNLPYHITEPLIAVILTLPIDRAVFLVGERFAREIYAETNSSDFGKLTLMVNTFFEKRTFAYVHKTSFYPAPRTDSVLIYLEPRGIDVFSRDRGLFILRELFATARRSPLVKNAFMEALIKSKISLTKNTARRVVAELNLPDTLLNQPIEQLDNSEFSLLHQAISRLS